MLSPEINPLKRLRFSNLNKQNPPIKRGISHIYTLFTNMLHNCIESIHL